MKRCLLTIFILAAILFVFAGCGQARREQAQSEVVQAPESENSQLYNREDFTEENKVIRSFEFSNGDSAKTVECSLNGSGDWAVLESLSVSEGSLRVYGFEAGWTVLNSLEEGVYNASLAVFDSSQGSILIYLPINWALCENHSRQLMSYGRLEVVKDEEGFVLKLLAQDFAGQQADYTIIETTESAIDWSIDNASRLWGNYSNSQGDGRWCADGYYFVSPSTYSPAGENMYYWMSDAYLVNSMSTKLTEHNVAKDFALVMLSIISDQQTEAGFFPTFAESGWLASEYSVHAGFYDTRFNTGLITYTLNCYNVLKDSHLYEIMRKYKDFYIAYATEHHKETKNGFLVEDYVGINGGSATHASLNHHLAETLLCYQLYDLFGDEELLNIAEKMLNGVKDTWKSWIKEDGDFYYALYPSGVYSGDDYPYLTYNDLYALQNYLVEHNYGKCAALEKLMDSKREWMDANGITQYKK